MSYNKELELAWDFVNNTNRNVFLTGKAGTGKTTFLHKLKMKSLKRMVVVAPTGVAAINAKGMTIHSFFQMPFGPIIPNQDLNHNTSYNRKFSKTKINIIKSLDLVVIDEISMVRADLLDAIDQTLRRFRNKNLIFGGVQLLLIGDLQQLSPVVKEHEWQLLKPYYKNAFFFSSIAYQKCNPITIELKHIYRQDNPKFIEILNEIRNNNLSPNLAAELNKRYLPNFEASEEEGYISLTTHNRKAEAINKQELDKLNTKSKDYAANVAGKFPEYSFPNKETLTLKVGAQVMFIKNDSSPEKRYFNGKIGKVIYLDKEEVVVKCPEDDYNIITTPESWENINYQVNPETKAITENKIGTYTQMPLRLAWAITIHKSQGLTFEKAIIDAQGAFAHGQTYVALSRCKSLEGLVLKSKIEPNQIINDNSVLLFQENAEANQPNQTVLEQSVVTYQLQLIAEIFNFYAFLYPVNRILDIYYSNKNSIQSNLEAPFNHIKNCVTNLLKVANAFKNQLNQLSANNSIPELNSPLQSRFKKAIEYFNETVETQIAKPLKTVTYSTDNKTIEKDILKALDLIDELLTTKQHYFKQFSQGFNTNTFLELRAKLVFTEKKASKKTRKTVVDGTSNIALFELLRELRNEIASEKGLIHFQIFSQKSLYEICEKLPTTKAQLLKINGFGKTRVNKYGDEILEVIKNYVEENNLDTAINTEIFETKKPKKQVGESKRTSLSLFKKGKTIAQIALERELNENTIFGHLASFIPSGEIQITDLISNSHYQELLEIIPKLEFENLSDLKHQIDEKYTFGELRLVLEDIAKQ